MSKKKETITFGKVKLIKKLDKGYKAPNGQVRSMSLFQCYCGKKFEFVNSFLKKQKTPSCGCAGQATIESATKEFYRHYFHSAKDREIDFNLTLGDFKKLINKSCYYCKSAPRKRFSKYSYLDFKASGVDRVDNEKGYSLKNCVACCPTCNTMKNTLTHSEFISHIEKIANKSCGDDFNTKTTYVTEANVGDTTKILLLCIYDLVFKFNLQKAEVKALFNVTVDEHINEIDYGPESDLNNNKTEET